MKGRVKSMKKEIKVIDMRNGDVFISFGEEYAHIYFKEECKDQIKEDIYAYKNGADTSLWDNNEIEHWKECYESDTTDELTIEELMEELNK